MILQYKYDIKNKKTLVGNVLKSWDANNKLLKNQLLVDRVTIFFVNEGHKKTCKILYKKR